MVQNRARRDVPPGFASRASPLEPPSRKHGLDEFSAWRGALLGRCRIWWGLQLGVGEKYLVGGENGYAEPDFFGGDLIDSLLQKRSSQLYVEPIASEGWGYPCVSFR